MKYLGIITIIGISIVLISCSTEKTERKENIDYKAFYNRIKLKNKDIENLFGFTVKVNAVKDGRPLITKLGFEFENGESVTLPAITADDDSTKIQQSPFYGGINSFINMQSSTSNISIDSVLSLCFKVTDFAYTQEAYDISSSNRLGKFVVFTVSPTEQIVYVSDTSKVTSTYWKNFFKKGEQLDASWYYKRTK